MNKKTFPLLLMVFALVSCGTQISKELEDYLLNMNYQKVYDDTNNGLVKSTYDEYNNDLLVGTHYQEKEFGRRLLDARMIYTIDRKSTRLNSSHQIISYAVFCLKKK